MDLGSIIGKGISREEMKKPKIDFRTSNVSGIYMYNLVVVHYDDRSNDCLFIQLWLSTSHEASSVHDHGDTEMSATQTLSSLCDCFLSHLILLAQNTFWTRFPLLSVILHTLLVDPVILYRLCLASCRRCFASGPPHPLAPWGEILWLWFSYSKSNLWYLLLASTHSGQPQPHSYCLWYLIVALKGIKFSRRRPPLSMLCFACL